MTLGHLQRPLFLHNSFWWRKAWRNTEIHDPLYCSAFALNQSDFLLSELLPDISSPSQGQRQRTLCREGCCESTSHFRWKGEITVWHLRTTKIKPIQGGIFQWLRGIICSPLSRFMCCFYCLVESFMRKCLLSFSFLHKVEMIKKKIVTS